MSNTAPRPAEDTFPPPPCPDSAACAAALNNNRDQIARALLENLRIIPRWGDELDQNQHDIDAFIARELHVFVDYVLLYLKSGDDAYTHLYIGEKLKQAYDAGLQPEEAAELRRQLAELDARAFLRVLAPVLPPGPLTYLEQYLDHVHSLLAATGQTTVNILFVQDCLYLDIVAFLTAPLLQDGIGIAPVYATSKNPEELRRQIRSLSRNKIDAVFFSPFTYEFSPEFAQLLRWRNSLMTAARTRKIAQDATADTKQTLDLISDLFDCPIFVHNTAMLIREPSPVKRRVKNLMTLRVRRAASTLANAWLTDYVARKNNETFAHLFLLDETEPLRRLGEHALGALFYSAALQHPAAFGREIARHYRDVLFVQAWLIKKKLVVCDLDNTLWEGLIGEGEVRHYAGRQQVLKDLRHKGVVLAVNSKNDPANIHWAGCALSEDDFVCREIGWEPKVNGMRRIQSVLNLKLKDYVFIDDRADERELIGSAFPDILTMNANDPRTWRLLGLWSSLLETNPEMDRTLLYRQREERQAFLQSEENAVHDTAAMFKNLELRVDIRRAQPPDLKRVVELINRTNQFNLCATRTSFAEAASWANDPDATLLVAHAADRFGDMGMVCTTLVRTTDAWFQIPVFVLSCRVFGYGIENTVMNRIKRLANGRSVTGWYKQTPQNGPCKNFYPDNGFTFHDNAWVFSGEPAADPAWLTVATE